MVQADEPIIDVDQSRLLKNEPSVNGSLLIACWGF